MTAAAPSERRSSDRRGLLLLEAPRALFEASTLAPALPLLLNAPRGDGHPVLVLPGFIASDVSTRPLRAYLRERGYAPHGWELGRNRGPDPALERLLHERLDQIHREAGRRVSLVGWSLGGVYARELARRRPAAVRQVITLGSPFGPSAVPPVPATAIYSRSDGIVDWESCLERETQRSDNIEVTGSHCGLGVNPLVLFAIADRLALPEDGWKPFDRGGWRGALYG